MSGSEIVAKYGVVQNKAPVGGWLPMLWYFGRARGHEYDIGWCRDIAMEIAKAQAEDLLARNHVDRIEPADDSQLFGISE